MKLPVLTTLQGYKKENLPKDLLSGVVIAAVSIPISMGYAQLAHTASAMGETAAENAMGMDAHYDQSTCPTCVYILPEAASVGLTEADCKAQGLNYLCGKFPMA